LVPLLSKEGIGVVGGLGVVWGQVGLGLVGGVIKN